MSEIAALARADGTGTDGAEGRWAVVVDDGKLVGWVSTDAGETGTAGAHARPFAVEVPLGTSLRSALAEMLDHDIGWLPVVDDGRYLGILTPNLVHAAMRRSLRDVPAPARRAPAHRATTVASSGRSTGEAPPSLEPSPVRTPGAGPPPAEAFQERHTRRCTGT